EERGGGGDPPHPPREGGRMSTKERVAAVEGWFTLDDADPRLLGNRCTRCGSYFFPKASEFCRNPSCDGTDFEEAPLSTRGTVWSFTTNHYAPPAPFVAAERLRGGGAVRRGRPLRAVLRRRRRTAPRENGRARAGRRRRRPGHAAGRRRGRARPRHVVRGRRPRVRRLEVEADRGSRLRWVITTSPSSAGACIRGGSGVGASSSTASPPPAPPSKTPGSSGATSSSCPAPTPSGTVTRGMSRARRSRRRSDGRARQWRATTPPARPA